MASQRAHDSISPPTQQQTVCHAFRATVARDPERIALRTHGVESGLTWGRYSELVDHVSAGLAADGVGRGDSVAMMLTNRPEAFIVDVAALHLGAAPLSIYNTSSPEQIQYLLGHAEARVLVTERRFLDAVRAGISELPELRVYLVDGEADGAVAFGELEQFPLDGYNRDGWQQASPEDIACLMYTSGTTGPPKGVELTHANLTAYWTMLSERIPAITRTGTLVSYLPMAHLADRIAALYPALFTGSTVVCVADASQIVSAVRDLQPVFWLAPPRIWEKLQAALSVKLEAEPALHDALDASRQRARLEFDGQTVPQAILDAHERGTAALAGVRSDLGLDDTVCCSGAAPISVETLTFFHALGIPIAEGWGMTESTALGALHELDDIRPGTVGKALPGVEIRVAHDGELLLRGPNIMRGYRNDPKQTAEAIDAEGWLHTGDIGTIDEDGHVRIVDRMKELIINAAGKNMSPANIENTLKGTSPLIDTVVVIGDGRPYNTALIRINPEAAATLDGADAAATEVAAAIARGNKKLSRVEQIKDFTIITDDWQPGGDELTPTMKLRRKPISDKYAREIDAMYAQPRASRG